MDRNDKKRTLISYIILVVFSFAAVIIGNRFAVKNAKIFSTGSSSSALLVKVTAVVDTQESEVAYSGDTIITQTVTTFEGTVLFGERKGETVTAVQTYDTFVLNTNYPVSEGDWIYALDVGTDQLVAGNYFRIRFLALLFVAVIIFLIVFARLKGVAAMASLGLTIASVFGVFVPAILSGYNVYLWTIIICVYSIVITPLYIGGFNRKSVASIIGCIAGVGASGILTAVFNVIMKITGFASEDDIFVLYILPEPIDMRAITFAVVIIGALGSTLDVSMSISSSVWEMYESTGNRKFKSLLDSGTRIGRDILGTQISTLVLAYIGSGLSTVLLLFAYQSDILQLMNLESVIIEIYDMLIGALAIILTIPFTALVSAAALSSGAKEETVANSNEGKKVFHRS